MSWDIYGNPLRRGHCEVHPHVHEEYPCSVCISSRRHTEQSHDELAQLRYELAQADDYIKHLQMECNALVAERDALAALLEKMKFITPEMLRAAQVRSELGAYACSELSGAYSLISEIYTVMIGEFMKQTTPDQYAEKVRDGE